MLFINASSASLLSQCLSPAAVPGRSPYLQLCRLHLQSRGCCDSEEQALKLFICSRTESSVPGKHLVRSPVCQCPAAMQLQFISTAVPGTSVLGSSVFAC